jgi:hypothetical protein
MVRGRRSESSRRRRLAADGRQSLVSAESRAPAADGRHPLGPAAAMVATASGSRGGAGAAVPRSNRADRGPLAGPLANRDMQAAAARCTGALRRAAAALPGGRLPPRRAGAAATQGCRRAARPCRGGLRLFDQVLRLRGRCCACSSLRML